MIELRRDGRVALRPHTRLSARKAEESGSFTLVLQIVVPEAVARDCREG